MLYHSQKRPQLTHIFRWWGILYGINLLLNRMQPVTINLHLYEAALSQNVVVEGSVVEGSCLQEFQSVLEPVGVQNQESVFPRTDEESSQSGVAPSMSGNDYTVPIASSPVAKETEVEGHPARK